MSSTTTGTLSGRSVILAGGSGGLGSAVAELVADRGGIPVIGCLEHEDRARALADVLGARHGIVCPVVCGDVLETSVRRALIEAGARCGQSYGLVSLVGRACRVPLEEATEADFLDSTRSNLVGPLLLARDFVAGHGEGDASVVFISTMQGVGVFPGSTLYAAPKAALVHSARILARQWDPRIRVNVVAPGVTRSGMAQTSVRSGKYDPYVEKGVILRFGESVDIARAVGFLLEPDNYITGQVLTVDGGLTARM